ncbi:MAG: septum formation initiator family protein [Candidatus Cryptobacteroides sp.]
MKKTGKIKAWFTGPHKDFAWFCVFAVSVFLILWIVGPGNTVFTWSKAKFEICRQERQIQEYQEQIKEMDARINALKHNRDTLEKFARENFYFAEEGEDVFLLE